MKSKMFFFWRVLFLVLLPALLGLHLVAHSVCRKNVEIPILKASARIATRLNYLCPQFFPAPGLWSLPNHDSSKFGCLASREVCHVIEDEICFTRQT